MASLTEAAKAVLTGQSLEEGATLPTPGSVAGGVLSAAPGHRPDSTGGFDPSTASTGNAKTLRPNAGYKEDRRRPQNGAGSSDNADFEGQQQDLGGQTPTSLPSGNLGAAAASAVGKDATRAGKPATVGDTKRPQQGTPEREFHEDVEVSDELEAFVAEAIEAGLSEEEIEALVAENFDFISEEEELEEMAHKALTAAGYTAGPKDATTGFGRTYTKGKKSVYVDADNFAHFGSGSKATVTHGNKETAAYLNRGKKKMDEELEDYPVDMSEHVNALLAGENLSEEFKSKATTIFEAAVKSKLEEEVALLEQAYAETLEERVAEIQEQLASDIDDYLNYVVEQWIEENEVAVESALRSELTEDFIGGLRALFAEHYIDVPEDRVSVVEELSATVEELEDKLNEEIERSIALTSALNESRKVEIFHAACDGLTTTQAEKLRGLAESVDYTSDEEYFEKISTLRENYFTNAVNSEHALDRVESQDPQALTESTLEGPMAKYVNALGRSLPK